VPLSVIALDFDPFVRLGDRALRLETLGLAGAILAGLLLAGLIAGRTRAPQVRQLGDDPPGSLRRDDLLFMVLGIVPGAVIGGRLGYVLLNLDYYRAHPGLVIEPASGGLQLSLGVVLGILTGLYVASLLDAPVGRWLHVLAIPLLVTLGLGKLAMVLGGDGQGAPSNLGWATAYGGGWTWGSLGPGVPSHPAQVYEAIGVAIILVVLLSALFLGAFERRDGRLFLVALAAWAGARFLVAFTWRDPSVVGSLRLDQVFSVVIVVGCLILLGLTPALAARRSLAARRRADGDVNWPDPETRPRF
jgi:phosphatidylglycerol:prolipoprotein diacylglycerol transferase